MMKGHSVAARAGMAVTLLAATAGIALAQDMPPGMGQPKDWQMDFQLAATPVMEQIIAFHNFVLPIITVIALFVLALLAWIVVRYNRRANPVPSKTTHHTGLEVAWTVIPIVILVIIAVPSFRLLFLEQTIPQPDMTIKATGHQWYWSYEYPDHGGVAFDANMVADADLKPGQPRLLATDNEVVVPLGKVVRVQVTAADVLHAFAMPSFGVKVDAVPGRLNETWFKAEREGIFYGQCSELCGLKHAFMPIAIRVVSAADFDKWVAEKRAEQGITTPNRVAEMASSAAPLAN